LLAVFIPDPLLMFVMPLANAAYEVRHFTQESGSLAGCCAFVGAVLGALVADEWLEGATWGAICGGFLGMLSAASTVPLS
jgi:hypothetical protein